MAESSSFAASRGGQRILTSSNEDLSEYTDAEESISAPTEILAEFLSSLMQKDYISALKYCKIMLQYEPNNKTANELYPLIMEKIDKISMSDDEDDKADSSSSEGNIDDEDSEDDEDEEEEDEEDEEEVEEEGKSESEKSSSLEPSFEGVIVEIDNTENIPKNKSDSDGTTNSYSSLEDEEVLRDDNILEEVVVERNYLDDANGNTLPWNGNTDTANNCEPKWLWEIEEANSNNMNIPIGTQTVTSDSESPTDPITQQTTQMLRANFVPTSN